MIIVIDVGPALQEQLDHMSVSPTGSHGQDTRTEPVPSIDFGPILQQDVGDSKVTKPGWRITDTEN